MLNDRKDQLLKEAVDRVDCVQVTIQEEKLKTQEKFDRFRKEKDPVSQRLAAHFADRIDELSHLHPSPFFVRCDVSDGEGGHRALYFGKHQLIEESIFSWTSPAARLRFLDIGAVEYSVKDNELWRGKLDRKDQFLISDGHIVFMTSESGDYARTLVHQEQLMKRKTGFMLPEIVERMERAQDDVVRADYRGSFLIAGPAGSGKTTLAFHRIAYLLQSPDTTAHFTQTNMIVFVQDDATKTYFSQLLPELGIHDVTVTTFATWGFERLGIVDCTFVRRANGVNTHDDTYELHKLQSLRGNIRTITSSKDAFETLNNAYSKYFSDQDSVRFGGQAVRRQLDRIDLTLLLLLDYRVKGGFTYQEEYFEQLKSFEIRRKFITSPINYSCIVLDEIQNYLPEQVSLIRSCLNQTTRAILYVGDLGQRVLMGTMRDWSEVGEDFSVGRRVELDKVYRSTKQILEYIRNVGFGVTVPSELRDGQQVSEHIVSSPDNQLALIRMCISANDSEDQIGILGFSEDDLLPYIHEFSDNNRVHVLTAHQAQGVEFEKVYIIGIRKDVFGQSLPDVPERTRIQRDLMYVALTRAMDELTIVGACSMKEVFNSLK